MTMHSNTPSTRHPLALTLSLLIVAEKQQRKYSNAFEDAVYEVLERTMELSEWADEKKADLYARLAESLTAADTMIITEDKVNKALWAAERA